MRRILFLSLLLFSSVASAAELGVWGERGATHAMVLQRNYLLAADGRGLAVYDTAQMRRVMVARTDEESLDVVLTGPFEATLLTRNGINRYTIASSGALTLTMVQPVTGMTQLATDGTHVAAAGGNNVKVWQLGADRLVNALELQFARRVLSIAFAGGRLFVAVEGEGIYGYDVAAGPTATSTTPELALDLASAGSNLYAAAGTNGVIAIDVSSPDAPRVIARAGAGEVNLVRIVASLSNVFGIEPWETTRVYDNSLRLIATVDEPVQTVAGTSSRFFLAGAHIDRFNLRLETGAPVRAYNILANGVTFAGEITDLAGPVSGVATDGTFAYVVDPPFFRVIDISTPSQPRELSSLRIDGIQDHIKLDPAGDRALIYGRGDVNLVDVTDPYAPRLLGVYHSMGRPPSTAAFIGNAILEANPWSGFHVLDWSNPASPGQIGGLFWHYYEVIGRADSAFIFTINAMRMIDLTDLRNPVVAMEIQIGGVHGAIAGDRLLVVHATDALHIYDITRPLAPVERAIVPLPPASSVIAADDNAAYLASDGGVIMIDLRNPSAPVLTPLPIRTASPMQIAAAGGKVVVADRYSLKVYGERSAPPPPPPAPAVPRRRPAGR